MKCNPHMALVGILAALCMTDCKSEDKQEVRQQSQITNFNQKWVAEFIEAYQALNQKPTLEAAELLFEATESMPIKNWDNYFMIATVFAANNENDKAFLALNKAIANGLRDSILLVTYPQLAPLRDDSSWNGVIANFTKSKAAYNRTIENPDLLKTLEDMWAKDQLALSEYQEAIQSLPESAGYEYYDKLFEPVEIRWEINKNKLDSIIQIYGWPGNRLVGAEGAKLAWAIPQHHPDVFFKEKCLKLLERAIQKKDVDPNHYAELHDRIARETWRKQTYGASMGEKAPYPIQDPVTVNKRRSILGLAEPIEIYALYHNINYNTPSVQQAEEGLRIAQEKAQYHYAKFEKFWNKKQIDSANNSIASAIRFYGDIDDEQLFAAALKLAQLENDRSKRISIKILKVLIWRKWEKRESILTKKEFKSLHDGPEWLAIKQLLSRSKA